MIASVFGRPAYAALACAVFACMMVPLLWLAEFLFFEPYITGHVPSGSEISLLLIVALCGLSGAVVSLNVYRIKAAGMPARRMGGGVFGSLVGSAAGACSCGPLGFALLVQFGVAGAATASFLTAYEIPIRAASVAVLAAVFWAGSRSLGAACAVGQAGRT